MLCTACGAGNSSTAKFCGGCGAGLASACPGCGHTNPPANRFCGGCGAPLGARAPSAPVAPVAPQVYTPGPLAEKIRSGRAAMEGERKQVTVMFADVVGSTALSEKMDPEETYDLMRRCVGLMLEQVHRYEGTVTQFLGDGILALFGAPLAHEDHAQRAVHAALGIQEVLRGYGEELQSSLGVELRWRVGLNSGLVVVGAIGSDLSMTYTAIGDTVNLASRVEGLAEPGTVAISRHTHRLVRGHFEVRSLGERRIRGKEDTVAVYEVVRSRGSRSRVALAAERGLTPFMGRRSELATLLARAAAAGAGQGQVVLIRGEAGIGKSRLLHELRHSAGLDGLTWVEGGCISFGREIAYFPLIALLRRYFGIAETDADPVSMEKIEAGAAALGSGVMQGAPYLRHLLGVDPGDAAVLAAEAPLRKAHTREAVCDLLTAASRATPGGQPLVVLVEDLHWIDPLSEEALFALAGAAASVPLLLLLTARPEYQPHPERAFPFTVLDLLRLSDAESEGVAQGLVGKAELPEMLRHVICRKAEGNPFFIEEVTRSLEESEAIRRSNGRYVLARPLEEIRVPDTIQDVIMARLDRLPEAPKRALQTASVIGREFTARLLERMDVLEGPVAQPLRELQAVELIYAGSAHPESAYMFKHALTHEVAYHSLLVSRRRTLHRSVGNAIEALYPERLPEQYETLAHHYERAEAWPEALDYLQQSGDKARAAFAPHQAATFYARALAVLGKLPHPPPERVIALHAAHGDALCGLGDEPPALVSFRAMLQAAEASGDRVEQGRALVRLANTSVWAHCFEDALEYAERARLLAVLMDDAAVLAGSLCATAMVRLAIGDLDPALDLLGETLGAARRAGDLGLEAWGLIWSGVIEHWQGEPRRALEQFARAIRICRQERMAEALLFTLFFEGLARCACGEYQAALLSQEEGLALALRLGNHDVMASSLNGLGWISMDLCHWDHALEQNRRAVEQARTMPDLEIICNSELNVGDCYLALGRLEEARQVLQGVAHRMEQPATWGQQFSRWRYGQRLNVSLGELWLARGDAEQALTSAAACLAVAGPTRSLRNITRGRRLRAEALLDLGRLEEADGELQEALRAARKVGNPAQLRKTLAVLGRLRETQGRLPQAAAAYREALVVVEGVAAGLSDPALRDALLTSSEVAALRKAAERRTN